MNILLLEDEEPAAKRLGKMLKEKAGASLFAIDERRYVP